MPIDYTDDLLLIAGMLIAAFASGWISGFLFYSVKRLSEHI